MSQDWSACRFCTGSEPALEARLETRYDEIRSNWIPFDIQKFGETQIGKDEFT